MEGMDGMSLLREVKSRFPWVPTIIVTGYGDIPLAIAATKAGFGFLEKPVDRDRLLSAIQNAMEKAAQPEPSLQVGLSPAEVRILRDILDGKTNWEIARSLNRSIRTIEAHRRDIMRKLGTRSLAQLVRRALALGFDKGAVTNGGSAPDTGRHL
jgi:two-component system response regulator FixJ